VRGHPRRALAVWVRRETPDPTYGASLWSRWPEFGLHISKQGRLLHWRGARDERAWPAVLNRGGAWPWTPETDKRAVTFASILEEVTSAGKRLSVRELGERLDTDRNQSSAPSTPTAVLRSVLLPADASFCAALGEHGKPRTGNRFGEWWSFRRGCQD
jgi:hypothetical protein